MAWTDKLMRIAREVPRLLPATVSFRDVDAGEAEKAEAKQNEEQGCPSDGEEREMLTIQCQLLDQSDSLRAVALRWRLEVQTNLGKV